VKDERFDLENELRAGRSEPRSEFVTSLAGNVRGRARRGRIGLSLALAGLMVVAVASFGGIGTAATSKSTKQHTSAAAAQYAKFTPKTEKLQPPSNSAAEAATQASPKPASAPSTQLPFTGLALWVPLAIGLVLIGVGVTVRTRARRHGSGAH
jgi:hypothetical protein